MGELLPKMQIARLLAALAFCLLVLCALVWLHPGIEALHAVAAPVVAFKGAHPFLCAVIYFVSFVLVAAICLPAEIPMAIAGGALFGFIPGVALASFAANFGALAAFLMARFFFRGTIKQVFGRQLKTVDDGVRREGAFYVVALRLLPVFPFSLTNITLGVTAMRASTFYLASQLSTLPALSIYANAGTRLAQVNSMADIMTPGLMVALCLLAVLPWVAKAGFNVIKSVRNKGSE